MLNYKLVYTANFPQWSFSKYLFVIFVIFPILLPLLFFFLILKHSVFQPGFRGTQKFRHIS